MPLPNFQLRTPEDDSERRVIADVKQFGWHVVQIQGDDVGPQYSFTVGLYYTYSHPEILMMGLDHSLTHQIFNVAEKEISKGKVFDEGSFTDILLNNYLCKFAPIRKENYHAYLGFANWFYRSLGAEYPALQILWPDKGGKFPDQDDFNTNLKPLQTLL